ncbi:MAG TPA: MFS transporter [Chloroflexota bacterium]
MGVEAESLEEVEPQTGWIGHLLAPYRVLQGNRSFDLIFAGQSASFLADWLYIVSLIVIAYAVTGSATFVAILTFVRLSPYALLMPFMGMLADRGDRRLMLILTNLGRGACVLGLLAVDSKGTIWLAFPLVFAITTLSSIFRPTIRSMVPEVVDSDHLVQANSLLSQVESLSFVVGPGLGSVFILIGHPQAAFAVTGLAYIGAAVAFYFVKHVPRVEHGRPVEGGWLSQNLAGFRFLFRENQGVLAAFTLAIAATGLLSGAFWTLILVLAETTFHLGPQGTGYLNAANGIGGLLGGLIVGLLLTKLRLNQLFIVALIINFAVVIVVGASPIGAGAFAAFIVFGITDVVAQVAGVTVIQTATPSELLGRVFAAFESILVLSMLIGTLLAGPLIGFFGPRAATIALAVASLAILAGCLPLLLKMQEVLGVRIFLRQIPVLTALSLQVLDDFASRLQVERFTPGTEIVHQGDYGDRLYIMKSGDVDVSYESDGRPRVHLATLSTMDYFGEIALLRDVQRTASVHAKDEVEAYSLMRTDFQELLKRSRELELAMAGTSDARLTDTQSKLVLHR